MDDADERSDDINHESAVTYCNIYMYLDLGWDRDRDCTPRFVVYSK